LINNLELDRYGLRNGSGGAIGHKSAVGLQMKPTGNARLMNIYSSFSESGVKL
jgi:hypothetical protein